MFKKWLLLLTCLFALVSAQTVSFAQQNHLMTHQQSSATTEHAHMGHQHMMTEHEMTDGSSCCQTDCQCDTLACSPTTNFAATLSIYIAAVAKTSQRISFCTSEFPLPDIASLYRPPISTLS